MTPEEEVKLAVAIAALSKTLEEWRKEMRRVRRRLRELQDYDEEE